ncbi:hypothetical protein AURDEDRAFT_50725 [Auricularia subglabra TFB-10046 SS5]|nr:hypothetical protein AURDEDRAFT_50725 [Auricularia subglabra TFB-10046 SS5]
MDRHHSTLRCRWNALTGIAHNTRRSSLSFQPTSSLLQLVAGHLRTLFLFTYADYKTVFVPIGIFAAVAAPCYSASHFVHGMAWIWMHLLQCNVSNQYKSAAEDKMNRPWRPIPAGRVTESQAAVLRWVLFIVCMVLSACYGRDVALVSLALTATMYGYDEMGLAHHWVGRSIANVAFYATFELAATKIMGEYIVLTNVLDDVAQRAILLSVLVKLSTNQFEDFADVAGDASVGRVTLPIQFPRFARGYSSAVLVAWSAYLGAVWNLPQLAHGLFLALAIWISARTVRTKGEAYDVRTRVYYNVRGQTLAETRPS